MPSGWDHEGRGLAGIDAGRRAKPGSNRASYSINAFVLNMYKPTYIPKLRLNYAKTWACIKELLRQPERIRPEAAPAHLLDALAPQKVKTPKIKGNVVHTMKEIVNIFIANYQKATKPLNLAIQTTRAALAKRCSNKDPKTAYRHVLALIEHGFLRGKVHVKGGVQLLLNPALLVFDAAPAVARAAVAPSAPAGPALVPATAQETQASLLGLVSQFIRESGQKISLNGRRTT